MLGVLASNASGGVIQEELRRMKKGQGRRIFIFLVWPGGIAAIPRGNPVGVDPVTPNLRPAWIAGAPDVGGIGDIRFISILPLVIEDHRVGGRDDNGEGAVERISNGAGGPQRLEDGLDLFFGQRQVEFLDDRGAAGSQAREEETSQKRNTSRRQPEMRPTLGGRKRWAFGLADRPVHVPPVMDGDIAGRVPASRTNSSIRLPAGAVKDSLPRLP